MYCMEFLEANFDWLLAQLAKYPSACVVCQRVWVVGGQGAHAHFVCSGAAPPDTYFLFDCPGQVELYTHHESMTRILERLNKEAFRVSQATDTVLHHGMWIAHACCPAVCLPTQLAAVHLVDAQHCKDGGHFISMALTSLATMMRLELPHVNVLSKIDLFQRFGMPRALARVVEPTRCATMMQPLKTHVACPPPPRRPTALSLDSYTRVSDLHLMASMIDRPPADADSAGGVDGTQCTRCSGAPARPRHACAPCAL